VSRATDRQAFDELVRVSLLETDMDDIDAEFAKLSDAIDGMRKVLVSILVSTATAAVLLAVNLVSGT